MLTPEQRKLWFQNGYLVLPRFFSPEKMDAIDDLHRHLWKTRPEDLVVDDLDENKRMLITEVHPEKVGKRFKLNDLYLDHECVREVALDERLSSILAELLVDAPVLCNSLSLDYGVYPDFPTHVC